MEKENIKKKNRLIIMTNDLVDISTLSVLSAIGESQDSYRLCIFISPSLLLYSSTFRYFLFHLAHLLSIHHVASLDEIFWWFLSFLCFVSIAIYCSRRFYWRWSRDFTCNNTPRYQSRFWKRFRFLIDEMLSKESAFALTTVSALCYDYLCSNRGH